MRFLPLVALAGLGCAAPTARPSAPPPGVPAGEPERFESRVVAFAAPRVEDDPPSAGARPARRAPLRFELGGRPFPLPLVHGTVAGVPTWMLVDTGANSHVIAGWLAKKAKLSLRALGDVGTDHTGHAVTTYSADEPQVALDGWGALDDGPMLVTDVPDAIEKLGIGAFVSPQWLANGEGEAVVLDLPRAEMHSARFGDALRAIAPRGKELAPEGGHLCEDTGSAIPGLGYVLPGRVEGRPVQLLLDTGAQRSDLLTTAAAGRALGPRSVPNREQMYAASGLIKTRIVKAAKVEVGQWSISGDLELVPGEADPTCPRDGVVSMDILQSCVLVLGKTQMAGRCGG